MRPLLRNVLGLTGFAAMWQAAVWFGVAERSVLPPPSDVAVRLAELLGQASFLRDVAATVLAWLTALSLAAAIAVPAGLVLGAVYPLRAATRVLIEFLRPVPPVVIVPLIMMVLGSGTEAKVTLACYAAVWPMLFNTLYALDEIDPVLIDTARAFGIRRLRLLLAVALPHAAPFAFTGLRLSAAIALLVTVSTEYLAGSETGVGAFLIDTAGTVDAMDWVLAGTVVVGVIGLVVNGGLERLGRRMFRWNAATSAAP